MLPKISIITPTLNRADYLEQTILSVLNQNYPNLEYFVIDGGSSDGTLEILQRYSNQLCYLSEKDKGQSDALNKGLRLVSGEIVAYLNADDEYEPNALLRIGQFFTRYPEAHWVSGKCKIINNIGQEILKPVTLYKNFLLTTKSRTLLLIVNYISQPATFWRREVIDRVGYFDLNLSAVMDYDYWLRISNVFPLYVVQDYLARFRMHSTSKTVISALNEWDEELNLMRRYTKSKILLFLHRFHRCLITRGYQVVNRADGFRNQSE
ncbi:MAG: glycosyltransferase [Anaerolineales bacterium]|nr:glycosyltransferase [Anaerolineales bacterium]